MVTFERIPGHLYSFPVVVVKSLEHRHHITAHSRTKRFRFETTLHHQTWKYAINPRILKYTVSKKSKNDSRPVLQIGPAVSLANLSCLAVLRISTAAAGRNGAQAPG